MSVIKLDPSVFDELVSTQRVIKINYKPPTTENTDPNKIRIVCMSDTHSLYHDLKFQIPNGDIFIHAGSFTADGKPDEVLAFNEWIGGLPHKHKLVIAGNREFSKPGDTAAASELKNLLTNCTYLEDNGVELDGIKFWGSPMNKNLNSIPDDTDILITHSPPFGFGDESNGENCGCTELLSTIQKRVKPRYSIFGHILESYGLVSDGKTIFINASTCDINCLPNNPPVVFDFVKKVESENEENDEGVEEGVESVELEKQQKGSCLIM